MVLCKKCKQKISIFATKVECSDCDNVYCEKCADTETKECQYCEYTYCNKCLEAHTPDCKEANESQDEEEDEEEEMDGITFSKDKTICILDINSNNLDSYINELPTLLKEFTLNTELSDENSLVWIKK